MKAGKYYIGDLGYIVADWDMFCNECLDNEGEFSMSNGIKGCYFFTKYGDGTYHDDLGNSYDVDAGLIGCVRIDSVGLIVDAFDAGAIIEFKTEFTCSKDNGVLRFGHIYIES